MKGPKQRRHTSWQLCSLVHVLQGPEELTVAGAIRVLVLAFLSLFLFDPFLFCFLLFVFVRRFSVLSFSLLENEQR